VTLRVVLIEFASYLDETISVDELLPFVKMVFESVHHLEYFSVNDGNAKKNYCWKQVDGECVICNEAEFPSSLPCTCADEYNDW
jgi:hypothetical protein